LQSGLGVVHKHASKLLTARLATPQRAEDDWSIQVDLNCSCSLCAHLENFLRDPDQTKLEWPLAKDKRRQVHGWIDHHDLPVDHNTRRKGSPYVLVLQKTTALFERDKAARRQWAKDLDWLEQTYPDLTK